MLKTAREAAKTIHNETTTFDIDTIPDLLMWSIRPRLIYPPATHPIFRQKRNVI